MNHRAIVRSLQGRGRLLSASLLLAALLAAAPAHAEPTEEDKTTARALLLAGRDMLRAGNARAALEVFVRAHGIMHVPTTGLDVARAQKALGRLREARQMASEVEQMPPQVNEPPAFRNARKEAAALVVDLDHRIPSLVLRLQGVPASEVEATVDGAKIPSLELSLPQPLNPGTHEVEVKGPDGVIVQRTVTLKDGETKPVEVTVTLLPVAPPREVESESRSKPLIYAGIGVSGALAVAGIGTAVGAAMAGNAAEDEWNERGCTSSNASCRQAFLDRDAERVRLGSAAVWTFVGAAVLGSATAIYALTGKKTPQKSAAQVAFMVTPQGGGWVVTGRF